MALILFDVHLGEIDILDIYLLLVFVVVRVKTFQVQLIRLVYLILLIHHNLFGLSF